MALFKRTMTVGGWTLASRVLGMVRDRILGGAFAGLIDFDAFLTAFTLPNLLRNLLGEGALSAAFIPRYVQQRDRNPEAAEHFAGQVLGWLALVLVVLWALGMVATVAVVCLGLGRPVLVALLAIPQLAYLIFVCINAILCGMLNGRRVFGLPAATFLLLNVVMIGTVMVSPEVRWMPYAVLATGIFQFAFLVLGLGRSGGCPRPSLTPSPELREMGRALIPTLISSAAHQINALVDQVIALAFIAGSGAVSYLYFGNRLLQFPMALIGYAVGTAIYPDLSSAAVRGWPATGRLVRRAGSVVWATLLPATAGLLVTAEPLVRAIYQTGRFSEEAVARTVLVVQMLALALVPESLSKLLVRAFYAHRDQRVPMAIGLAQVGANLGLNLILVQTPLREAGLALASTMTCILACACYALIAWRRGLGLPLDLRLTLRPLVATLAMAAAVWLFLVLWPYQVGHGWRTHVPRAVAAVGMGILVYGLMLGRGAMALLRGRADGMAG